MKTLSLLAFAASLALNACATTSECNANTDYTHASSVEPLKGANGIAVPDSPSALRIPPVSKQEAVAAAPANANRRTACLDFPPDIAPAAAK